LKTPKIPCKKKKSGMRRQEENWYGNAIFSRGARPERQGMVGPQGKDAKKLQPAGGPCKLRKGTKGAFGGSRLYGNGLGEEKGAAKSAKEND